jgi:DNA-binding response OmpR family regulator
VGQQDRLKILLVEDNSPDARLFEKCFQRSALYQFEIRAVVRLSQALVLLDAERFDAIILDLFLPDSEGLATLEAVLPKAQYCPVIVLTGLENEVIGIEAIQKGAEEYLVKAEISEKSLPRSLSLAVERKRMRLRTDGSNSLTRFQIGVLQIDLTKQEVFRETNSQLELINLTPMEFKILVLLARNPGVILSRSRIVAECWNQDRSISVRTLDKHVSSLKKKCHPDLVRLESVYGVGYSFEALSQPSKILKNI